VAWSVERVEISHDHRSFGRVGVVVGGSTTAGAAMIMTFLIRARFRPPQKETFMVGRGTDLVVTFLAINAPAVMSFYTCPTMCAYL
jgi:hypothetical protein